MEFDTFIAKTKGTYSDARASQNLGKLNGELRFFLFIFGQHGFWLRKCRIREDKNQGCRKRI